MRTSIYIAIGISASILQAQEWSVGSFSGEVNPVHRISQAVVKSKINELTPKSPLPTDNQHRYSYYLSSVRYLGGVSRGDQRFTVATVLFISSSPEGAEMPAPRCHGFLLMLDREYNITSYCRIDLPDQIELSGAKLYRCGSIAFEGKPSLIGDLASADVPSRSRGFLIEGDAFLPYPFSDRIDQLEATTNKEGEQAGADQPATRSEPKSEGSQKPQSESGGRSR